MVLDSSEASPGKQNQPGFSVLKTQNDVLSATLCNYFSSCYASLFLPSWSDLKSYCSDECNKDISGRLYVQC